MKAAVAHAFHKPLTVDEVPIPTPVAGQVLIRLAASGVCHTDLHAVDGDWPVKPSPPFVPGHEGVGAVAALGPGVSGVKEGDVVGVPWLFSACGRCEYCLTGWETLCASQQNSGYSVNGTFAEYVVAPRRLSPHPQLALRRRNRAHPLRGVTTQGAQGKRRSARRWVVIS
jgi:propanol-preferring alcohol dehydrogenase